MLSLLIRTITWWMIKIIVSPLIFILGPVKVYGQPKVDKGQPCLIICNHPSLFDPVLLFLLAPRPIIFLAAAEIFKIPVVGQVVRFFKAIPVERGNPLSIKKALSQVIKELKSGEIVALFPEGETSPHIELRKFNKGFLFIAKKAKVPIQCVMVKNTARVIPYGKILPRPAFKPVKLFWGKKFYVQDYERDELFLKDVQTHFNEMITKKN